MAYVPTPRDMRHRRETFVGSKMGPKHDWAYRIAPELGETDTGLKLFDSNKSFAILTSFHCPGMATPSDNAPTLASGHACGFASASGSKVGIRLIHPSGQSGISPTWMNLGASTTRFGFGSGSRYSPVPFKPYSQAGGRTLTIHRQFALDYETGLPTNLIGSASFELCGVQGLIGNQKATYSTSSVATDTLHVYSCEEIVMDMVAVYLRELTKEEEAMWRTYGLLP